MSELPDDARVVAVVDDNHLYMYPVRGDDDAVVQDAFIESDYWFDVRE